MRAPGRTRFRALVWSGIVLALGAIGCESDGGGPSGAGAGSAATPEALRDMCKASCARSARCNVSAGSTDAGANCVSGCTQKLGNLATGLRSDVVLHIAE